MISQISYVKSDEKIPRHITEKILTVGFEYRNHRGGIGGVIDTYSQHFESFKFVATYPTHPNKWTLLFYFLRQYFILINKLTKDKNIEIVHIHGAAKGSFIRKFIIFITAKYLFNLKVIYHSHGSELKVFYHNSPAFLKRMIHFFLENVDTVICLSEQWRIFFNDHFTIKKLVVLGNVVKPPVAHHNQSYNGDRPLKILFLGLIGHRKGIFDLLEAINESKDQLKSKLTLTIGGNGDTKRLTEFIANNKLGSLVNYVGWVSGEQKHHYLSESDLYILPSYNEGLPLSILEAMSYNLPIISTPVGGTSEIVLQGNNGFLVQPGDRKDMINRIKTFIDQPQLISIMGSASGQLIQQFTPEYIFPKLQNLYESLLNDH